MVVVVFRVGEVRFALPVAAVDRVFAAVDVTPLPGAPSLVLGIVDVHGSVVPVLNMRRRFLQPDRPITPHEHFVLAHTARGRVLLVVDHAEGVILGSRRDAVAGADIAAGHQFTGVITLDDGLALVHDLDTFLTADENRALTLALARAQADRHHGGNAQPS